MKPATSDMEGSKPFAFELVMRLAVLLIRECPMSRYEGCYTRYSSCSDCYQKGGMTRSDWLGDLLQVVTVKLSTATPSPLKCNMVPHKVEAEALVLVCILVIATITLVHTILHRGLQPKVNQFVILCHSLSSVSLSGLYVILVVTGIQH